MLVTSLATGWGVPMDQVLEIQALSNPYVWMCFVQVFDLQEYRPGPVLRRIWKNYEAKEREGDSWAPIVRRWGNVSAPGHVRSCNRPRANGP